MVQNIFKIHFGFIKTLRTPPWTSIKFIKLKETSLDLNQTSKIKEILAVTQSNKYNQRNPGCHSIKQVNLKKSWLSLNQTS